jgi:hypothetical protein
MTKDFTTVIYGRSEIKLERNLVHRTKLLSVVNYVCKMLQILRTWDNEIKSTVVNYSCRKLRFCEQIVQTYTV